MALILTRSPYIIENVNASGVRFDDNAVLTITISEINDFFSSVTLKTYTLNFGKQKYIDISPLVRDYLIDRDLVNVNATINGTINGVSNGFVVLSYVLASNGYSYYEEGVNKDSQLIDVNFYAGSNDVIYRYKEQQLTIPILFSNKDFDSDSANNNITISYYNGDTLVRTLNTNIQFSSNPVSRCVTASRVQYITESTYDSFEERVIEDGGTFENNECIELFDEEYIFYPATRIEISELTNAGIVTELTVVPVQECKYDPKKIVFVNKYGVKEDLWFFKKSTQSISTEKETFRANTVNSYVNGDLSGHIYRDFNVNGKESMTLNTGFVPESFKENFKQLMLSEKVWIDNGADLLPVNIKNTELDLKQSVNDKLINYTIEIEYSYDKINNIF